MNWQFACESISRLIIERKYPEALEATEQLLSTPGAPEAAIGNAGGFLIDIGTETSTPAFVRRGVDLLETITSGTGNLAKHSSTDYNLANGLLSLAKLELGPKPTWWDFQTSPAHRRAKLLLASLITRDTRHVESIVNFANTLDVLGRRFEALYYYDRALKLDPDHPMALGNRGISLGEIGPLLRGYEHAALQEALESLERATSSEVLKHYGGAIAETTFQRYAAALRTYLGSGKVPMPSGAASNVKPLPARAQAFLEFCARERLFLTYHVHKLGDEAGRKDSVFIRILDPLVGPRRFPQLATVFNQIKEDYAVARYLAFQASERSEDVNAISRTTTLVDLGDGTRFSVYAGLQKAAFAQAYGILDKIAFFLNDYLGLGKNIKHLYFRNFWWGSNTKAPQLHPKLMLCSNAGVTALVDVSSDLREELFLGIETHRHAQVHRCLVVTSDTGGTGNSADAAGIEYVTISDLKRETLELLRLVLFAIFALADAVSTEEMQKAGREPNRIAGESHYPTDQEF